MDLLIVLVLYEMNLHLSPTFRSLRSCLHGADSRRIHLLVYDNSSKEHGSAAELAELSLTYQHDPSNGGLSSAYNAGLALAIQQSAPWMLLLDQDSVLPEDFIPSVLKSIELYGPQADVAAIVPEVRGQSSVISPKQVHLGYVTDLKDRTPGKCDREITGINSGMAIRTSFISQIGGFNISYWLDFMDYWIFRTIYRNGAVAAFSGVPIHHSLSLETNEISDKRYLNMLNAESTFLLTERGPLEVLLYGFRLFARALKNLLVLRRPNLAWITVKAISQLIRRVGKST